MDEILIYKSSRELKQVAICFIGIVAICAYFVYREYMFLTKDYMTSGLALNIISMVVEGIIIVYLIKFLINIINRILIKEPFIIFERDEFISNGLIGKYKIKWSEVESYKERYVMGIPSIVIKLKNDSEHKEEASLGRMLVYKYNKIRCGGEFIFMLPFLQGKYDDVLKYIDNRVRGY